MYKLISNNKIIILLTVLALVIHLIGLTVESQPYDIGTYHAWGIHLLQVGAKNFFGSIWSDYLPLPISTFSIPAYLSNVYQLDFSSLFKLFNTTIELLLIYSIGISEKTNLSLRKKIFLSLLLCPSIIANTSYWGQVDAIPSLLSLLSLVLLLKKNPNIIFASVVYGLAVAYKPIMLLIAPVLWVLAIKKKYLWQFPIFSSVIFFLTALPYVNTPIESFTFLWQRSIEQSGTYPYLSVNAWNIWTLVPTNTWISDSTSVLGVSGQLLGYILFAGSTLSCIYAWYRQKYNTQLAPSIAACILISFYAFTTRMHERHLLFGLPFLAYASMIDYKFFKYYIGLSFFYLINLYSAYQWVLNSQLWPFDTWVQVAVSWGITITSILLIMNTILPNLFKDVFHSFQKNKYLFLILGLAAVLRIVNLSHPQAYIFDEVYHAFTAKEYLHNHIEAWEWWTTPPEGVAYEWTHPPVAKYGMVIGMLLFGENEFGYRVGSAVMGIVGILGLYYFTLNLTQSKKIALLSAFLLTIEGTHLVQSRIAMNDTYVTTFMIWSLYYALNSRWKISAILYGLALGSKWSALYGSLPLLLIYLKNCHLTLNPITTIRYLFFALRLVLITLATYILSFAPFILSGHSWEQWWELHRQMWYYHTTLVATHSYQSTPLQWLFAARPVWYWVNYGAEHMSNIYVQGNPLILWFGLVAVILQILSLTNFSSILLYILYFVFFLPWLFSPRIMFYYHYLPSSIFLLPILSTWITSLSKRSQQIITMLFILCFIILTPVYYGYPMPTTYWNTLFSYFPNWK
ncbi:MAG: phospholipid carrier-dependent glycosyltransferase [Thiothrix sp.]|nr:MAG: phospholipid carrier-dependent glycosyltransferase [Thiothrix sp.]